MPAEPSPRPNVQSHVLRMVEAFLKRTQMTPATFGRKALGDTNLVAQLREGRELRHRTTMRVLEFMSTVEGPPQARRRRGNGSGGSNAGAAR